MILDFRESSNNPNQNIVFISLQFCAGDRATFFPFCVHAHVDAEWDHGELFRGSDAKGFVNLPTLLMAHHDNSIGYDARQYLLDRQKLCRLQRPLITLETLARI